MQSSNWTVSHRSPSYLLLKWRYSIKYICVLFLKNPSLSGFVNEPPGPCLYKTFLQHYREVVKWFLTRQKNTHRAARRERGCVRALPFYFWRRLYAELSESVSRNIDLFHDVLRLTAPDTLLAVRKQNEGGTCLRGMSGNICSLSTGGRVGWRCQFQLNWATETCVKTVSLFLPTLLLLVVSY